MSKTHYIVAVFEHKRRDLTKSGGDFLDLVEISPDLKILADKCYVSRSVWVFLGFGEKIRGRTDQIEFWKKRPTADCRSSWVGQVPIGFTWWIGFVVELDTPTLNVTKNICLGVF